LYCFHRFGDESGKTEQQNVCFERRRARESLVRKTAESVITIAIDEQGLPCFIEVATRPSFVPL
jgi:hypothetical protein